MIPGPSGTEIASMIHMSRTLSRKLERAVVKIAQEREMNKILLKYLNRLSDYLYLASLKENKDSGNKEKQFFCYHVKIGREKKIRLGTAIS